MKASAFSIRSTPITVRRSKPADAIWCNSTWKQRAALKNKVNNLLSARRIEREKEDLSSERGLSRVLEEPVEGLAQGELEILVEQIRSLNRSLARLERVIEEAGNKLRAYRNLTSIEGIGPLGASILLSVIGNIEDFAEGRELAAHFGIVPRVQNSNETGHTGRITKRGEQAGPDGHGAMRPDRQTLQPLGLHHRYERRAA